MRPRGHADAHVHDPAGPPASPSPSAPALRTPHTKRRLPLARQGRVMENPSTFPSHQSISRSKAGHPSTFPAAAAKAHTAPPAHRCRSNGMLLLSHCTASLCPCERLAFWYWSMVIALDYWIVHACMLMTPAPNSEYHRKLASDLS
jgi:hypothetical protein